MNSSTIPQSVRPDKHLTCLHCGRTGGDVIASMRWIGGRGYVLVEECIDLHACWSRWESNVYAGATR